MIKRKTVFILGAGASHPYGLPLGIRLRESIIKYFLSMYSAYLRTYISNDGIIGEAITEAKRFCSCFEKSNIKSIDKFLSNNYKLYGELGKLAIMILILSDEEESYLLKKSPFPIQDWYTYLYNFLIKDIYPENWNSFLTNEISFVTFNYDRSLEHFFYESLHNSFLFAHKDDLLTIAKNIPIVHVYGKIADLDWQAGGNRGIPYGSHWLEYKMQDFTHNIKIIFDKRNEAHEELQKAKEYIRNAENIFFLGFGYAEENLKILDIPAIFEKRPEIYGTAVGLEHGEVIRIKEKLSLHPLSKEKITIDNKFDCLLLLRNFLEIPKKENEYPYKLMTADDTSKYE